MNKNLQFYSKLSFLLFEKKNNFSIWLSIYICLIIFIFIWMKNLLMTRRRKFRQKYSKQLPLSSFSNQQKSFSRKLRNRSMSVTTQIDTNAFDMLRISTESNIKPLEFIERNELTRYHALTMSIDQRPILFLMEHKNNRIFSSTTNERYNNINDDYYSSFV